jgi:hypothetical protein
MALEGVDCDTEAWLRGPCLVPVIARWCLYTPSPQSTITVISPLPVALSVAVSSCWGRLDGILYPGNVWLLVSCGETFGVDHCGRPLDQLGWRPH